MAVYVAMLRGINVSGQKLIKMEALGESLAALRFSELRTYVQSGNVVFGARASSTDGLSKKIAARIERDFGFVVPVVVRSEKELAAVAKANPERLSVVGREVYLCCPLGYGKTKLSNGFFEKILDVEATTRNWNTVTALCEMAAEIA